MKEQINLCHEEICNQFWEKVKMKDQISIVGSGIGIKGDYGHVK